MPNYKVFASSISSAEGVTNLRYMPDSPSKANLCTHYLNTGDLHSVDKQLKVKYPNHPVFKTTAHYYYIGSNGIISSIDWMVKQQQPK